MQHGINIHVLADGSARLESWATKANPLMERWATARVYFATFSMSNQVYNQRELISSIMLRVKLASGRVLLSLQVDDEAAAWPSHQKCPPKLLVFLGHCAGGGA